MTASFFLTYFAVWVIALFEALLILAILHELNTLRERLPSRAVPNNKEPLPIGAAAPSFPGSSGESDLKALDGIGGILLFLTAGCPGCSALVDSIMRTDLANIPRTLVFCNGNQTSCNAIAARLSSKLDIIVLEADDVAELYKVFSFPTAVVVDARRTIRGYGHPTGVEELTRLFEQSIFGELRQEASI